MPSLAPGAVHMPRSGIRRVMDAAWAMPGPVIGLHVGEPSFDPPAHVLDAARAAYAAGDTHYVGNAGVPALREAVAAKVTARNGVPTTAAQVVITAGGAQALHLAHSLTASAGDEVLVPDPGWPNYAMGLQLLGVRPVPYPLPAERGFQPDLLALERAVTPRTRAIVLNSPSNPLGTVLPERVVQGVVAVARARDLWVVSDECYDELTFDVPHTSAARYDTDGRVLTCFTFSKTYAMTGVRVGYLVAAEEVAATAAKLQEPLLSCVNAPAQAAALAALTGPQDAVEVMRSTYSRRRDAACALLDDLGVSYQRPDGAFYLWVDVRDRCGGDVDAWALRLLRERSVAVAPGTAFGAAGQGWARVSLATGTDDLLEGLRRLSGSA